MYELLKGQIVLLACLFVDFTAPLFNVTSHGIIRHDTPINQYQELADQPGIDLYNPLITMSQTL